ncbi:MAG: type II toxin-antitoxin system PemK/MazF family toxin [Acidobacteriota bacterium]
MTVGEVCWVELVSTGGHAQKGRRPAIILQSQKISARIPTVLVVPLTSQLDALRFPGTVLVEAGAENGLRRASVALVFQLTAIDQRFLRDRLGIVSQTLVNEIFSALDELAGRTRFASVPGKE